MTRTPSGAATTLPQLARLRRRLTWWYAGTSLVILAVLGSSVLWILSAPREGEIHRAIRSAVADAARHEATSSTPASSSGVASTIGAPEVRVFTADGRAVDEASNPVTEIWVRDAVMRAARSGSADGEHDGPGNETSFLYAERFTTPSGELRVAVGVTEDVEFEDRYGAVITAVGLAGLLAVLVIAAGGWFLVKVSTAPIEASIDQMRRLAADAAHELRSPLTVLRARADVALQQPRDASTYVETLRGIESDASRLGRIVDDLFVVARADAGERRRAHDRIALDDIVADATRTANLIATPKGVRLELTKYEEVWVDGDGDLLRQLVMILLDNAVKFTGHGGIVTMQVSKVDERPTIVVEDTGIGISREHLPHVFDRFFRADAARPRLTPEGGQVGAGLGLSIAKWIADIHGGDIEAESELGKGTRMTVRFPSQAA